MAETSTSYGFEAGFDADGHRAWFEYHKARTPSPTYYLYDGDEPIMEVGSEGFVDPLLGLGRTDLGKSILLSAVR
jgi:hypothetical protein